LHYSGGRLGRHPTTLLLLGNEPAKVVSERQGHSSVTVTLETNSHALRPTQKSAAGVMAMLGRRSRPAGRNERDWLRLGYKPPPGCNTEWTRPASGY